MRTVTILFILVLNVACMGEHESLLRSAIEDAEYGDTELAIQKIEKAINAGANPNYHNDGKRIAEIVIDAGRVELFKKMIDQGLNVKTHDYDNDGELDQSLLNWAIYDCIAKENDMCTPILEAGADPNGHADFEIPILLAAENRNLYAVKLLLKYGARLRYEDYDSVLLKAAEKGALDIVKFLIEQGEKPEDRKQLMSYAIYSNNLALVEYLLPDYQSSMTPDEMYATSAMKLAYAETEGSVQKAKSILKLFRQKNIPESGKAYDQALVIATAEKSLKKIEYFIEHGASFPKKGEAVKSLLARLLYEDDLNRVVLLMNPLSKRYKKAEKLELELISYLLKQGLPLDGTDKYGRTGLMYAAMELKEPLVKLLIAHNADKSIRDKKGKTAREYVISSRPTINEKDKAGNAFKSALGINEDVIIERQRRSDSIAELLK
jgi:ankyrin repeat protein